MQDLVEFTTRCGLIGADASGGNLRFEIVFALDGLAGETAEQRELTDVRESIGDRALEELCRGFVKRLGSGEIVVKGFQCGEETVYFDGPILRGGIAPGLLAARDGEPPIEEVIHVGQDFYGSARVIGDQQSTETRRCAAQRLCAAISYRSQSVAEKVALGIRRGLHGGTLRRNLAKRGRVDDPRGGCDGQRIKEPARNGK